MSCKVMYTCDHCGKEVSPYLGKQWRVTLFTVGPNMDDVHGCSKEHLGIALAKMFGIGVNGEADELLNRKQRELTKLTDANNFLVTERDNMRARLAELEARMPANEVTNAERMQYETTIELQQKRIEELEKRIAELTPPDASTESGLPDAVLASITLPTKPTKPLRERLEELASYWEKGAASGSMSEGYRQASKDCAKELREVIDDPR